MITGHKAVGRGFKFLVAIDDQMGPKDQLWVTKKQISNVDILKEYIRKNRIRIKL